MLLTVGYSQQVIAVSDITSEGLSKIQKKQIFNKLETELVNLGAYEVTSRSEVDKILAEQKFQSSGCTDQQCAAEIGRLLNADLMLLSDILYDKDAKEVSITLKLVNVETAKIATAISKYESIDNFRQIFNKVPGYLLELYRNQNINRTAPSTTQQTQQVGTGKLIVRSDPVGAKVILDNKDAGLTPFEKDLEAGKHRLILTYKGYERFAKSVTVISDTTEIVEAELVSLTGDLAIISTPSNSDVFINDDYKGKTPLTLQFLEVGEYFIKIKQEGYVEELSKVTVDWNQTNTVKKTLTSLPGSVAFYSVPEGVEVLVDNRSRGFTKSSGLVVELPVGKYKVQMKKKGYASATSEIIVKAGETSDLELSLTKLPEGVSEDPTMGWISITGSPKKSQVTIKGENYSIPLKYHELRKGNYSFKAKKSGYKTESKSFKITAQKHIKEQFMLNPIDRDLARKYSFVFPGLGHFYAEKPLRGLAWMGLQTASLYTTYLFYVDFDDKLEISKQAQQEYKAAVDIGLIESKRIIYEQKYKDKNNALYTLIGMGVVSLGTWVWNTYDVQWSVPDVLSASADLDINIRINEKGELETKVKF